MRLRGQDGDRNTVNETRYLSRITRKNQAFMRFYKESISFTPRGSAVRARHRPPVFSSTCNLGLRMGMAGGRKSHCWFWFAILALPGVDSARRCAVRAAVAAGCTPLARGHGQRCGGPGAPGRCCTICVSPVSWRLVKPACARHRAPAMPNLHRSEFSGAASFFVRSKLEHLRVGSISLRCENDELARLCAVSWESYPHPCHKIVRARLTEKGEVPYQSALDGATH